MKNKKVFACIIVALLFLVSTAVICRCLYANYFRNIYFINSQVTKCQTVVINRQDREVIKCFLDKIFIAKKPLKIFEEKFSFFYKKIKHMCDNISPSFVKKMFKEALICKNLRRICKEVLCCNKIKQGIWATCPKSNLNWCEDCYNARKETRFYLMLLLINKLAQQKDKSKEIQYVSFGAGSLLQDYLVLKFLIQLGFKNIQVHVIDILYDKIRGMKEFGVSFMQFDKWRNKALGALKSFKTLLFGLPVAIHTYTTHNEFLEKWDIQKKADLLFLIDPVGKGFRSKCVFCKDGELLWCNTMFANHIGIEYTQRDFKGNLNSGKIIALLSYWGKPEILYKGSVSDKTKQFLLQLKRAGSITRSDFIKKCKDFLKASGIHSINVSVQQSQRFSFYELVKHVATKKTLLYQLDGDRIFSGGCNIRKIEYLRRGYKKL